MSRAKDPKKGMKYYLWIMTEVFRERGHSKDEIKKVLRELADLL